MHHFTLYLQGSTCFSRLHDVAHGINPAAAKREDRDAPTFWTLAERYRDEYALKKRSYREMARIIDRMLVPHFGAIRAKEITRREVKELVGDIAARAPIMANRTLDLYGGAACRFSFRTYARSKPKHNFHRPVTQRRDTGIFRLARPVFFGFRKAPIAVVEGSFCAPRHKLRKRLDVRIDAGTVQCFKVGNAILDPDDCP
jgi:hypothetical protein